MDSFKSQVSMLQAGDGWTQLTRRVCEPANLQHLQEHGAIRHYINIVAAIQRVCLRPFCVNSTVCWTPDSPKDYQ